MLGLYAKLTVIGRKIAVEMITLINGSNFPPYTPPLQPLDDASQTSTIDAPTLSRDKRGIADAEALWPQFSTIRISLMGMTNEQEQFTKDNINKWAPYVNLTFEFTDGPDGDIRFVANNNVSGGYSYVGTRAQTDVAADQPTGEIGFEGGLNEFNAGTIIHEFGHALALLHEHQHPEHTLDYNWEQIRQDYEDQKIPHLVDVNFAEISSGIVKSDYDQSSVMHYSFPAKYLKSGSAVEARNDVSEKDKAFAMSLYPKAKPPDSFRWWQFPNARP